MLDETQNVKVQLPFDKGIYWKLSHFTSYLFKSSIVSYDLKIYDKE